MNVIEISCPAKTFILGEYAVLDGGSAIILNTAPRFACRIQKGHKKNGLGPEENSPTRPSTGKESSRKQFDLAEHSPAGQWVRKNPHDFQSVDLEWINPYENKGGLGFSSAQFNILYAYSFILRSGSIDQIKPQEIWRSYKGLHFEGFLPSGADVISQWVGGVGVFEQNPLSVETLISSLPDLHCLVLRTGEYFETHKYLKNFQLGDVSDLKKLAHEGVQAIKQKNEEAFINSINDYRKALLAQNYVCPKTQELLDRLVQIKSIKACKGCGAMGAETLIVFYNKQDEEEVKKEVSFLECVADVGHLTYGVTFHKLTKPGEISS